MKKLLIVLVFTVFQSNVAQENNTVSVFHRLLIYNSDNQIMLVKIKGKGAEVWVTPGIYQDSNQFIKKGLDDLVKTYGIETSSPELKGVFSVQYENDEKKEMWLRNYYTCKYIKGDIHFPKNQPFTVSEIKWVSLEKSLEMLSHEFVKLMLEQTHNNPNLVSGGSISVFKENHKVKVKIEEEFYPLFHKN